MLTTALTQRTSSSLHPQEKEHHFLHIGFPMPVFGGGMYTYYL